MSCGNKIQNLEISFRGIWASDLIDLQRHGVYISQSHCVLEKLDVSITNHRSNIFGFIANMYLV